MKSTQKIKPSVSSTTKKVLNAKVTDRRIRTVLQEKYFQLDVLLDHLLKKLQDQDIASIQKQHILEFLNRLSAKDQFATIHVQLSLATLTEEDVITLESQALPTDKTLSQSLKGTLTKDIIYADLLRELISEDASEEIINHYAYGMIHCMSIAWPQLFYFLGLIYNKVDLPEKTKGLIEHFVQRLVDLEPLMLIELNKAIEQLSQTPKTNRLFQHNLELIDMLLPKNWREYTLINEPVQNSQVMMHKTNLSFYVSRLDTASKRNGIQIEQAAKGLITDHMVYLNQVHPRFINNKPVVDAMIVWANELHEQVKNDIRNAKNYKTRIAVVDFYIGVAKKAFALGSMDIAMNIQIAFASNFTNKRYSKEVKFFKKHGTDLCALFNTLVQIEDEHEYQIQRVSLFDNGSNFTLLRSYLHQHHGVIPLALLLKDLTFTHEANTGVGELRIIGKVLENFHRQKEQFNDDVVNYLNDKNIMYPPLKFSNKPDHHEKQFLTQSTPHISMDNDAPPKEKTRMTRSLTARMFG